MAHKFAERAFTPTVKAVQEKLGSRRAYARLEDGADTHDRLGPAEMAFIARRDSFYMATVKILGRARIVAAVRSRAAIAHSRVGLPGSHRARDRDRDRGFRLELFAAHPGANAGSEKRLTDV